MLQRFNLQISLTYKMKNIWIAVFLSTFFIYLILPNCSRAVHFMNPEFMSGTIPLQVNRGHDSTTVQIDLALLRLGERETNI